jgi:aspartyl-tRNA(Asn)/glutamyl-tRNA(Gln) amidotransferase subunit B
MSKEYKLTVGLEVHAELSTKTKMFCDCINNPEENKPNLNICPVCLAYPGTLPVINKEAVRQVIRFGTAVKGNIADFTEFDRKNYFYPDIPKGYQISQYKFPLVSGGELAGIKLTRVHLEEDTAKSSHTSPDYSLVDYNRAGVPLMELVTEPVIHTAEDAANFAKELQLLLWYLDASKANMEKGEMRVEANISVSKDDNFGTKVEVKNLNSFKAVEKAIGFEMNRHIELLEKGEKVIQETRGWDENKEVTFSQRAKEDSHDYRYFPDPDLPKIFVSLIKEFSSEAIKETIGELPEEKRSRYKNMFGIKDEDIEIFVRNNLWGNLYEKTAEGLESKNFQLLSNYITSDLVNLYTENEEKEFSLKITPEALRELILMIDQGELSSRGAKDILKILVLEGGEPREIAEKNNLFQKSDEGEIIKIVEEVINKNEKVWQEYKEGNVGVLQFLIGQGMKESKGNANPQILKKIFEEKSK